MEMMSLRRIESARRWKSWSPIPAPSSAINCSLASTPVPTLCCQSPFHLRTCICAPSDSILRCCRYLVCPKSLLSGRVDTDMLRDSPVVEMVAPPNVIAELVDAIRLGESEVCFHSTCLRPLISTRNYSSVHPIHPDLTTLPPSDSTWTSLSLIGVEARAPLTDVLTHWHPRPRSRATRSAPAPGRPSRRIQPTSHTRTARSLCPSSLNRPRHDEGRRSSGGWCWEGASQPGSRGAVSTAAAARMAWPWIRAAQPLAAEVVEGSTVLGSATEDFLYPRLSQRTEIEECPTRLLGGRSRGVTGSNCSGRTVQTSRAEWRSRRSTLEKGWSPRLHTLTQRLPCGRWLRPTGRVRPGSLCEARALAGAMPRSAQGPWLGWPHRINSFFFDTLCFARSHHNTYDHNIQRNYQPGVWQRGVAGHALCRLVTRGGHFLRFGSR